MLLSFLLLLLLLLFFSGDAAVGVVLVYSSEGRRKSSYIPTNEEHLKLEYCRRQLIGKEISTLKLWNVALLTELLLR